jgi:glutathione S-transferase
MKGEHRSPEYLAKNPAGKVPCLLVDDRPLAENVAIVIFLARTHPDAKLLPFTGEAWNDARILSDLAGCASGLHPLVTRIRIPNSFCDMPGGPERVYELATQAMTKAVAPTERRLATQPWMLDEWSILDAYVNWVWFRITGAGFDASAFPALADHAERHGQRPAVRAALAREAELQAQLEAEGLAFVPPSIPNQ